MHQTLSLPAYTELLQRFYLLYVPLETLIAAQATALADLGVDVDERRKSAWLHADLLALRAPLPDVARPQTAALPEVQTVWGAMGCLYVTEGATLGGQLIARHLRRHLRIDAQSGARFFASYGKRTGIMWKQYKRALLRCDDLEAASKDCIAATELVAAARRLFAAFHAHLTPGVTP